MDSAALEEEEEDEEDERRDDNDDEEEVGFRVEVRVGRLLVLMVVKRVRVS